MAASLGLETVESVVPCLLSLDYKISVVACSLCLSSTVSWSPGKAFNYFGFSG